MNFEEVVEKYGTDYCGTLRSAVADVALKGILRGCGWATIKNLRRRVQTSPRIPRIVHLLSDLCPLWPKTKYKIPVK